jgi:hypothetical protein
MDKREYSRHTFFACPAAFQGRGISPENALKLGTRYFFRSPLPLVYLEIVLPLRAGP